ncbi:MAG: carboxylesterase/lipase family protein [Caulobacteraceae bacterium]
MRTISAAALAAAIILSVLGGPALAAEAPSAGLRVRTTSGVVEGSLLGPSRAFFAIPYAAPPIGPRRWKPPEPAAPWSGVREAKTPGPACPQKVLTDGRTNEGGYTGPTSEDCLTLDVIAPLRSRRDPVMVWIFGGGDVSGGTNLPSYDARNFARDGVVFVAMNYRLGALGFFAQPALTAEAPKGQPLADYGLMDQIAALKWVRANIARFGGDPDNVTIFGESAGGEDVLALMAIGAARGLFEKAIVESGGGWGPSMDLAHAEARGAALAAKLGLAGAKATPDELRALPAAALVAAEGPSGPILDGRLLKKGAEAAFAAGEEASVPLMIGSNSNEASLMAALHIPSQAVVAAAPASVKAVYAADGSVDDQAREMFNDLFMGAPARELSALHARKAPAFLYYFAYVPTWQRTYRPGVNHATEIPFVFDSIDAVANWKAHARPEDRKEAQIAHACWLSFARTGAPRCGGASWPAYTSDLRETALFDEAGMEARADFRKRELDAQAAARAARLANQDEHR